MDCLFYRISSKWPRSCFMLNERRSDYFVFNLHLQNYGICWHQLGAHDDGGCGYVCEYNGDEHDDEFHFLLNFLFQTSHQVLLCLLLPFHFKVFAQAHSIQNFDWNSFSLIYFDRYQASFSHSLFSHLILRPASDLITIGCARFAGSVLFWGCCRCRLADCSAMSFWWCYCSYVRRCCTYRCWKVHGSSLAHLSSPWVDYLYFWTALSSQPRSDSNPSLTPSEWACTCCCFMLQLLCQPQGWCSLTVVFASSGKRRFGFGSCSSCRCWIIVCQGSSLKDDLGLWYEFVKYGCWLARSR